MSYVIPLEQLMEEWKKDSYVDQTDLIESMLRIPKIHSKYLNQIVAHRRAAKDCRFEIAKVTRLKWEYYTGKLDGTQKLKDLGWPPFQFKLLKATDVDTYLESDVDLIKLNKKLVDSEQAVYLCEEAIKHINSMTFQVREIMNWRKFSAGERG